MNKEETRVALYTYSPDDVTAMDRLLMYDRLAKQSIEEAEALIAEAKAYRMQLAKRVQELNEMQFHIRTTLQRERNSWTGKVRYFLRTEKAFDDGTAQKLDESIFEGKERHKAIAEFRAMKKKFPGYEFVEDIEKSRWER